jgi:hypothetical protein
MSKITDIEFGNNVDKLINELSNMHPNKEDMIPEVATKEIKSLNKDKQIKNNVNYSCETTMNQGALSNDILMEILNSLKVMNGKMSDLQGSVNAVTIEITEVKAELTQYKNLVEEYKQEITVLKSTNKSLQQKVNEIEKDSRINKLILSGPIMKFNENSSPEQILDHSIKNIKNVYNFDLTKNDISNCHRLRGKDNNAQRVVLSLNNNIKKSALISKVIQTDKTRGISLSINEYLSSHNSHILWKLRCLRKEHPTRIFSCFSRNGNVFYKAQRDSRPKQLSQQEDIDALADEIREHGMILHGQNARRNPPRSSRPPMGRGNGPPARFNL